MTGEKMDPETPTPETDALIDSMLHADGIPMCEEWNKMTKHARSLERRLSESEEAREALAGLLRNVSPLAKAKAQLMCMVNAKGALAKPAYAVTHDLEGCVARQDYDRLWTYAEALAGLLMDCRGALDSCNPKERTLIHKIDAALSGGALDQGREVAPHRSGGGHWVGPSRSPSVAELIANVEPRGREMTNKKHSTDDRILGPEITRAPPAPPAPLPEPLVFLRPTADGMQEMVLVADYDALRAHAEGLQRALEAARREREEVIAMLRKIDAAIERGKP